MTKLPATGELSGRSVLEWIGKTPDTPVPDRVVLRILLRQERRCALTGVPLVKGEWTCDHIIPLADGGENRESNLHLIAKAPDKLKTSEEAKSRAKVRRIIKKSAGITKPKKPFPGSRGSKYKRTLNRGTVLR
jgi:5-methylcytosine-specific restriction endonuclease McrA